MAEAVELRDLLRQAGAVMTGRGGRATPAHYGSAAGELAACMAGVGLADRSDLAVLSIAARRRGLDHLLARVLGHGIAPNGALFEAGVRWCRSASADEVVVICPYGPAPRLKAALRRDVGRLTGGRLADRSESRLVLHVLGRRAGTVLTDLGVYGPAGDPREVPPFIEIPVDEHRVSWVLESPTSALAIVDTSSAGAVWQAVGVTGRRHDMSRVGLDAVERYLLAERIRRRTGNLPSA